MNREDIYLIDLCAHIHINAYYITHENMYTYSTHIYIQIYTRHIHTSIEMIAGSVLRFDQGIDNSKCLISPVQKEK